MRTTTCQRWRSRRTSYRPARELFDPDCFEVAPILTDTEAKHFVCEHHYSGSYPAARYRFGLWRGGEGIELAGVAVFSVPVRREVTTSVLPGEAAEHVELGRLVLLDNVLANAESWFVAQCFRRLRAEGIVGVVSFSDPMARPALDGSIVMPGHVGTVYQALSAVYVGQSRRDTMRLLPDGSVLSSRALAKIRKGSQGHRYAEQLLVRHGATPRRGLDPDTWLREWLPRLCRTVRHPGNYKYCWALDRRARRHLPESRPYPKVVAELPKSLAAQRTPC
jgi:hypothetical protein